MLLNILAQTSGTEYYFDSPLAECSDHGTERAAVTSVAVRPALLARLAGAVNLPATHF